MLAQARHAAGLTQTDVAARTGRHRNAYALTELPGPNALPASPDVLARHARAIGMPEDRVRDLLAAADRERPVPVRVPPPMPADRDRPVWSTELRRLRYSRSLTVTEAARRAGITPVTWTGMETGTRFRKGRPDPVRFTEQTVDRLARALDLDPAEHDRLDRAARTTWDVRTAPWQRAFRDARRAGRLTVDQAARAARVTPGTYRAWENSEHAKTPDVAAARRFLAHPAVPGPAREHALTILASLPSGQIPRTPGTGAPIPPPPEWSRLITAARLAARIHLAAADTAFGSPGVVRRYELGGWPRKDGRLTVPTRHALDKTADAVHMYAPADRAGLHRAADRTRITNAAVAAAAQGLPLAATLLREVRQAAGLSPKGARVLTRINHTAAERGNARALTSLTDPAVANRTASILNAGPTLARAFTAAASVLPVPPVRSALTPNVGT